MGRFLVLFFSCLLCCLFCSNWASGESADEAVHAYHGGRVLSRQKRFANVVCNPNALYRTINGTCNNLDYPLWGSKDEPYLRLLAAAYEGDQKNTPRLYQKDGTLLPSARLVSTTVHVNTNSPYHKGTIFAMVWGQFIAHDILGTPTDDAAANGPCCSSELVSSYDDHKNVTYQGACFPIIVPKGDREFTNLSTRCLDLVRSSPKVDSAGVRQQFNQLSSYIDATTVYGTADGEMEKLRTFSHGLMKVEDGNNLPRSSSNSCVLNDPKKDYCMLAGDHRVNVYPPLGALHTIFVRYHNYVATQLREGHSDYDDETLFQEARKIVIAIMQRITYSEYLPVVLGKIYRTKYNLTEKWSYNRKANPTLFNSFPTAAFRFGHSMVTESLKLNGVTVDDIDLFLRPHFVLHDLPSVLDSSASQNCQSSDRFFALGMSDHLFSKAPQKGSDIVSLNIQRGRDHGLPPYNKFRKMCGLQTFTDFSQMASGCLFKSVYNSVDDIDLYSGAMAEAPEDGGVGPTFSCLLGMQFQTIRDGDRFWFETKEKNIGFNSTQRKALRKTKLSHVICLTTNVTEVQEDVFIPVRNTDELKSCSYIKSQAMDLALF